MSKRSPTSVKPVLKRSERHHLKQLQLKKQLRWQTWAWLILFTIVALLDWLVLAQTFPTGLFSKSFMVGASVSWLGQVIFTKVALQIPKRGAWQQMVTGLYVGQMLKWLLTLFSFALIFRFIAPLLTWATLAGYVLMQVIQLFNVAMWSKNV